MLKIGDRVEVRNFCGLIRQRGRVTGQSLTTLAVTFDDGYDVIYPAGTPKVFKVDDLAHGQAVTSATP